ncbi:MAG: diaminopimelate epimerase [Chitinophagales bacterium]|nr:diaminopimelate epimerase [Chitinophagales bacterium]MDW8420057.1 diaminopimelate epimerase [Chitinophagales bacterium]
MLVKFCKYQGAGNDFIMIDNRHAGLQLTRRIIERWCHRKYGVGADGLILLGVSAEADFAMTYYNSDGGESTFCGNGGRCLVRFANHLGLTHDTCTFVAADGLHHGRINRNGTVSISMQNVSAIHHVQNDYVLNTGSPHYVIFVKDVKNSPVKEKGREIRNSDAFAAAGINVNFAEVTGDATLYVRTYERGVEDETLSCGTGVVAAALAYAHRRREVKPPVTVETPGGTLQVDFLQTASGYENIFLTGPAVKVYEGAIMLDE